jgi:hypothetical protein
MNEGSSPRRLRIGSLHARSQPKTEENRGAPHPKGGWTRYHDSLKAERSEATRDRERLERHLGASPNTYASAQRFAAAYVQRRPRIFPKSICAGASLDLRAFA